MKEDSKSLSRKRYTKYGQGYVKSETHAKGEDLEGLLAMAQPQPDWMVLDVATGAGHTALKLAPLVAKVIATDLTPKMLAVARDFIAAQGVENVEFRQADAEELPFEDETFELVTCRIAAHHFPNPGRFVQQSARVLKPDGLLLLQDQVVPEDPETGQYINAFETLRDPSHNRALSENEWVEILQRHGLTVEDTRLVVKRHAFLEWAEMQGCTPAVIEQLSEMLREAPFFAAAWLQAREVDTPGASFANHHLLIAGRKK
ncbi:MAG TPA: class I SAM-dependent methyltransferase [Anaerolineales bacterium]|nr:class I SAM-dependent methyltransferase [Anaerolineales bacterium]